MGVQLLIRVEPLDPDGTLLAQGLDAWEQVALTYRKAADDGSLLNTAKTHAALASAFTQLLETLPAVFVLPPDFKDIPHEDWELAQLRTKAGQVILTWCDDESRIVAVMQTLQVALARMPPPGTDFGTKWVDLEVLLWFA